MKKIIQAIIIFLVTGYGYTEISYAESVSDDVLKQVIKPGKSVTEMVDQLKEISDTNSDDRLFHEVATEAAKTAALTDKPEEVAATATTIAEGNKKFLGGNFGMGISLTHYRSGKDRINNASVVNGIVRVDDEQSDQARPTLEIHKYFPLKHCWFPNVMCPDGFGPFVAVQLGEKDFINAIGGGLMWGWKEASNGNALNIGIGAIVDPSVKQLGKGIREDEPLPAGETEVRYRNISQWGFLVMTSFSF